MLRASNIVSFSSTRIKSIHVRNVYVCVCDDLEHHAVPPVTIAQLTDCEQKAHHSHLSVDRHLDPHDKFL